MTIPAPRRILVSLEDGATAGVVATAAAHLAMDQDATAVILLHVIDTYMVAGGLLGMSGVTVPVIETREDQEAMLALAEAAIQAEYAALDRPVPSITRKVSAGAPAACIAQVAEDVGAAAIVVGARRPHAFGRLVHPDVRASLTKCTKVPVHVVPLQADVCFAVEICTQCKDDLHIPLCKEGLHIPKARRIAKRHALRLSQDGLSPRNPPPSSFLRAIQLPHFVPRCNLKLQESWRQTAVATPGCRETVPECKVQLHK